MLNQQHVAQFISKGLKRDFPHLKGCSFSVSSITVPKHLFSCYDGGTGWTKICGFPLIVLGFMHLCCIVSSVIAKYLLYLYADSPSVFYLDINPVPQLLSRAY